jgi:hypothetical protein
MKRLSHEFETEEPGTAIPDSFFVAHTVRLEGLWRLGHWMPTACRSPHDIVQAHVASLGICARRMTMPVNAAALLYPLEVDAIAGVAKNQDLVLRNRELGDLNRRDRRGGEPS